MWEVQQIVSFLILNGVREPIFSLGYNIYIQIQLN